MANQDTYLKLIRHSLLEIELEHIKPIKLLNGYPLIDKKTRHLSTAAGLPM